MVCDMNNSSRRNSVFGTISIIIASVMLVLFVLPFFVTMLNEQIRIGEGTSLDIAAIAIWIIEALLVVPYTMCIVFTILSMIKKDKIAKIVINISILSLSFIMLLLANLWMFI